MGIFANNQSLSFNEKEVIASEFNITVKELSSYLHMYQSYTTKFGRTYTSECGVKII